MNNDASKETVDDIKKRTEEIGENIHWQKIENLPEDLYDIT